MAVDIYFFIARKLFKPGTQTVYRNIYGAVEVAFGILFRRAHVEQEGIFIGKHCGKIVPMELLYAAEHVFYDVARHIYGILGGRIWRRIA